MEIGPLRPNRKRSRAIKRGFRGPSASIHSRAMTPGSGPPGALITSNTIGIRTKFPRRRKWPALCARAGVTSSLACPTPPRSKTRPACQNLPIPGGPPETSGTLGNPCAPGVFPRTDGRVWPGLAIGTIRTCWSWAGWGWGGHPTGLTSNEQYTHISLWCLLSAPLLLGCDLQKMDAFTFGLLSNDEVLALDQDALGRQATCVAVSGPVLVYAKDLEGGSKAVGLFNLGPTQHHGHRPLVPT